MLKLLDTSLATVYHRTPISTPVLTVKSSAFGKTVSKPELKHYLQLLELFKTIYL